MKTRLFAVILLSVLSLTAFAQKPKIAVYVTGTDKDAGEIIGDYLLMEIESSGKYQAVERTFLSSLNQEYDYERTGEVDDEQIAKLGEHSGAEYICVVSVLDVWNENYIIARIINAVKAEVIGSCSTHGSLANGNELDRTLDDLSKKFISILDNSKKENAQKVAVYIEKGNNRDIDVVLGDQLVAGFARSGKYMAVERTNAILKEINKEVAYQETGSVDDSQIIKAGYKMGLKYVCVLKVRNYKGSYFVTSRLIDVVTSDIKDPYVARNKTISNTRDVITVADEIVSKFLGVPSNRSGGGSSQGQDFTETVNGVGFKMVWVEGGTFTMGCTSEQGSDCYDAEKPSHQVTLSGYYIGQTEVTQALWQAVMGSNPSNFKGSNYPVEQVSWDDCQEFIRKLNALTGKRFALPTEAQWEYAARGGKKSQGYKYAGSNGLGNVAWYYDNSGNSTHPVATKSPNELGLYDMSGNVWEWCSDWKGAYSSSAQTNPTGPSSGSSRVLRGGSWDGNAQSCRVASRYYSTPSDRLNYLGFRVVLLP